MSSCFELKKNDEGRLCFTLKGSNGDTLFTSCKPYISKGSIGQDIDLVQHNCQHDALYERQSSNGKHFFNLQSPDHKVIATSPMFDSADSLEAAIAAARSEGVSAPIESRL
jgi:uncharacterized protein YegP (UPF0339 family)